ncbi:hypothetical protein NQ315_017276 [Exocentrus adspersus]|uniref:Pseudouridine synthase I TruA alpha/beta domain-containing protein n=1 Tax=Exocentrus adspersus TaxID=1586481 RepID=A0AAV8VFL1_9CUCU|nr:hypothetical protein NQ315_017276 [Exocentrus adspersus]
MHIVGIISKSKKVRRTVGSLVAAAQGKVTLRDIKFMLEIPSHQSWCSQIKTLPAHGLYLCQVEYRKEDWDTFRSFPERPNFS